jgi:hypothetical protein
MTTNTTTTTEDVVNIDDFLPLPGAEDIITGNEGDKKPNMFSNTQTDTSFLDNPDDDDNDDDDANTDPDKKKQAKEINADAVLDDLTNNDDDDAEGQKKTPGRQKIDKSGLVETFSKLIEKGTIIPFEDEKKLEEYSVKDWEELLEANIQERERQVREQTPKEFFESLPQELQYAAKYVADGGQDLRGLFRALASVEESRSLDPQNDADAIARHYLMATQFGTEDEIAEQIQEWNEMGVLEKKAGGFKPKLDRMQEQMVQAQLAQQEQMKQQREDAMKQYVDNVYETVKAGEINGIKLDKKTQAFIFTEMTTPKYDSISGKKVNLLGHLLEKYQFVEPNYGLIAEAMWLLSSPDEYKAQIKQQGQNAATQDTVRKLKTEQQNRISSNPTEDKDDNNKPARRTIQRPTQSFFKR